MGLCESSSRLCESSYLSKEMSRCDPGVHIVGRRVRFDLGVVSISKVNAYLAAIDLEALLNASSSDGRSMVRISVKNGRPGIIGHTCEVRKTTVTISMNGVPTQITETLSYTLVDFKVNEYVKYSVSPMARNPFYDLNNINGNEMEIFIGEGDGQVQVVVSMNFGAPPDKGSKFMGLMSFQKEHIATARISGLNQEKRGMDSFWNNYLPREDIDYGHVSHKLEELAKLHVDGALNDEELAILKRQSYVHSTSIIV